MKPFAVAKYAGLLAVTAYALVLVYFYVRQDHLTFYAQPEREAPLEGLRETQVETPDGETLIAWTHDAAPGCPTVLLFHGQWSKLSRHQDHYQRIVDHGLGLYALTWRGFNGSTGHPSEKGLHVDAAAAYEALEKAGVPADQIIVHGISLGTGPAVRLASEHEVGALILEAPYRSVVSVAQGRYPYLPIGLLAKHKFKSEDWIADVAAPKLIAHGDADSIIPFAQGEALFELAHEPKTFARFAGSEHTTLAADGLYEDAVWPFLDPIYPDCPTLNTKGPTPS